MSDTTIWTVADPISEARRVSTEDMSSYLGIEFLEAGDDWLRGRMPVDERTRQPAGVLHGGASVALAETLASTAAYFSLDASSHYCVGLEINANHIRTAREGYVYGIAAPLHLGRSTQVWEIHITTEDDALICICRCTMAILQRNVAS